MALEMSWPSLSRLSAALAVAAAIFLLRGFFDRDEQSWLSPDSTRVAASSAPLFERNTVAQGSAAERLHAPAIVDLGGDELLAVWKYRGEAGDDDTRLYMARFSNWQWAAPTLVTTAAATGEELGRYITKLGNAVLLTRPNEDLWLVYVSTLGGWSTSQLNLKRSLDGGLTWSKSERLVTSPFFNLSTLVKTRPLELMNRAPVIPAYHEMLAHLPELLFLNEAGQVRDKIRMGSAVGHLAIQPAVAVLSQHEVVAMMRPSGATPRIFETRSKDGGRSWSLPESTDLPNPGGPVGLVPANGRMLALVFNDDPEKERDLTLAVSIDSGSTWTKLGTLDKLSEGEKGVLTYPFLIRSGDENYDLVYADSGKLAIRHIRFNDAWLDLMVKQASFSKANSAP